MLNRIQGSFGMVFEYFILMVGTCAVLYPFFLCRMLGAGDIKLMAVCVGNLGVDGGIRMIFCGFLLAFLHQLWKILMSGKVCRETRSLMERWEDFRKTPICLAGYFLGGYVIYLVWNCIVQDLVPTGLNNLP